MSEPVPRGRLRVLACAKGKSVDASRGKRDQMSVTACAFRHQVSGDCILHCTRETSRIHKWVGFSSKMASCSAGSYIATSPPFPISGKFAAPDEMMPCFPATYTPYTISDGFHTQPRRGEANPFDPQEVSSSCRDPSPNQQPPSLPKRIIMVPRVHNTASTRTVPSFSHCARL